MAGTIPGFAAVGPVGSYSIVDGTVSNNGMLVGADNAAVAGGYVLMSILAELRVQTQFLQVIANMADDLRQLRADAINDMGTLYTATSGTTPIQSS